MFESPSILMVQDDADEVLLLTRALTQSRVVNPLHVVRTGEDAIAYLTGAGIHADHGRCQPPSLVLLDLSLSGIDGLQVLKWIRQQPQLRRLRVVITTGSRNLEELHQAYELGAEACLLKPLDFERFSEFSQALGGYWLWLNEAPEDLAPMSLSAARSQPE